MTTRVLFQVAEGQMIKTLDLNVSGTKRNVAHEAKPDRFPSIGDHIQVTPTLMNTWTTPRQTVIRGS